MRCKESENRIVLELSNSKNDRTVHKGQTTIDPKGSGLWEVDSRSETETNSRAMSMTCEWKVPYVKDPEARSEDTV